MLNDAELMLYTSVYQGFVSWLILLHHGAQITKCRSERKAAILIIRHVRIVPTKFTILMKGLTIEAISFLDIAPKHDIGKNSTVSEEHI